MREVPFDLDLNADDDSLNIKGILFKYLKHWPWFLGSLVLCVILGLALPSLYP